MPQGHCAAQALSHPPCYLILSPLCATQLHTQTEDFSAENGCDCSVCFTHPAFVALYWSADSISFWLINVQFEVYYEPLGFNYYTITQSIPCHFIFMAFIMPLYVQLPNFILERFHLISWVLYHSSHSSRLLFILVPCMCFLLCFFTSLTLYTFFFSFSWDALFPSPWKQLLWFLQTALGTFFHGHALAEVFHLSC